MWVTVGGSRPAPLVQQGRSNRFRWVVSALAAVTMATAGCGSAPAAAPPPAASGTTASVTRSPLAPVTTLPASVTTVGRPPTPGAPGELIDATPIDGPDQTRAWRLVYHSRSADGRDIAVTGLLVSPDQPGADIPIVTWGHPTTGTADRCTPSAQGTVSMPFPEMLTAKGIAIVSTDYEGLGSADPHPYLVGASEGHAMLDAVRAAQQVSGAGVTVRSPTVIWGFSQGGHAASFAGQLAPTYAPELALRGVAIAAPVSSVDHFTRRAEGRSDQFGVLVTVVGSFAGVYPELDPAAVFTPEVVGQLPQLEQECIGDINILFNRPLPEMLLDKPSGRPEFAARFAENQAGTAPIGVPVLVVQGAKDDIVDPADTQSLVDRYCAFGVAVRYVVKPDARHGVMSDQPYIDWIQDRLAGRPAPSTCPGQEPDQESRSTAPSA